MAKILGSDVGLTVSPQGLHERSATQKLRLGTRLVRGDRVFKYAKAGGTLVVHRAVAPYDYGVLGWTAVPTATPAGSTTVYATIGVSGGVDGTGVVAHELQGAWVTIFRLNAGTANTDYTFQILDNDAVGAGGGTITLTIDSELPYACTTDAYTEINGNIYNDVRMVTAGQRMFVGQPMIDANTTYPYLWLQTWGPTWLNPEDGDGSNTIGNGANQNQLVFEQNGSVVLHGVEDATTTMRQHAGCVISRAAGGAETQGTPLIFLQISC